ncbi:hypothetical protein N9045_01715 [bacterium]|nr:hypothetical protein [bacterium]
MLLTSLNVRDRVKNMGTNKQLERAMSSIGGNESDNIATALRLAQNVIVSIYDDLSAMHMKLREISSSDQELTSEYWELEEEFKKLLNSAVNVDLVLGLNKKQLLHVISMCSSYRPFAPHVMLGLLSVASNRLFEEKESGQGS